MSHLAATATPGSGSSSLTVPERPQRVSSQPVIYEQDAGVFESQSQMGEEPIRMPPAYNPAWETNRFDDSEENNGSRPAELRGGTK